MFRLFTRSSTDASDLLSSRLYNETKTYPAFLRDLANARSEVIIESPFISRKRANALYPGPISTTDTYYYGQCTYWAALRRQQTGKPIPNDWGNANTWAVNARLAGYQVDHTPAVGTVMQTTAGPFGHVAFVESVGVDGSWTISEMNFKGWDITDSRLFSASQAMQYNFIH